MFSGPEARSQNIRPLHLIRALELGSLIPAVVDDPGYNSSGAEKLLRKKKNERRKRRASDESASHKRWR